MPRTSPVLVTIVILVDTELCFPDARVFTYAGKLDDDTAIARAMEEVRDDAEPDSFDSKITTRHLLEEAYEICVEVSEVR